MTIRIATALLLMVPISAPAADPVKVELFEAGKGGYAHYRIPGLISTKTGTLLAYCEARKTAKGDWGAIDLLIRRSSDGGKTWSQPQSLPPVPGPHRKNPAALAQKLADPTAVTYNNPVAIADAYGVVHFLFCLEYMRCFYCRSDDDGKTFSAPVEITTVFDAFRNDYNWKVLATGPGHGIQLSTGRLLVPIWLSTGTGGHAHRPSIVSTIFSDDGGKSWRRGEIAANETDPLTNPSETVAVELADGRVMMNIRSESKSHRRAFVISPDGATSWTRPAFDDALVEPICMASLCRLTASPRHDRNRLLYANPHNLERSTGKAMPGQGRDRKNLTVKLSYEEGQTWAVSKTLEPGPSGYSDLAVGPDGTIFCLYERGQTTPNGSLTLARFDLDWLTDGKDWIVPGANK